MNEKKTGLALLREPFPPHQISKLPKPTKKQTDDLKADYNNGIRCKECGGWHHKNVAHLDYVGHAALTDRLLDADPMWNWEPSVHNPDGSPKLDERGGLWIKLTVCGLTRIGYGHADGKTGGDSIKETIGDALRNAAMRFGAALDLWHKGDLHLPEEPEVKNQDKATAVLSVVKEVKTPTFMTDPRLRLLFQLCKDANWKEEHLRKFVLHQFGLESNRLLTKDQFELLIAHLKTKPAPFDEVKK
jgi:hypothetical protein